MGPFTYAAINADDITSNIVSNETLGVHYYSNGNGLEATIVTRSFNVYPLAAAGLQARETFALGVPLTPLGARRMLLTVIAAEFA